MVPNSTSSTLSIPPFILPFPGLHPNVSPDFVVTDTVRVGLFPASVNCARVEVALLELSVFLRLGEPAISSLALRFLELLVVVESLVPVAMGFQIPACTPVSKMVGRGGRGLKNKGISEQQG